MREQENNWVGDKNSIFKSIGASNHTKERRERYDYYATEPKTIDGLIRKETFSKKIWEPSCGEGHLSKRLIEQGFIVKSSDLIDRGFGEVIDFFSTQEFPEGYDIITNPPYKYAKEYAFHALSLLQEGRKLALLLKLTFLEVGGGEENYLINTLLRRFWFILRGLLVLKMVILSKQRSKVPQLLMLGLYGKKV